jgi:hypothetical protein
MGARDRMLMVLAVLVGLAGGCSDTKKGAVRRLNPRSVPFLEGVPVPEGFKLVEKSIDDLESGGRRFARHDYAGWADPLSVRNFYEEQMPLLGWSEVEKHNVKGTIAIRFERRHEVCKVMIDPGMLNYVKIQAIVLPFDRSSAEPPRRPLP